MQTARCWLWMKLNEGPFSTQRDLQKLLLPEMGNPDAGWGIRRKCSFLAFFVICQRLTTFTERKQLHCSSCLSLDSAGALLEVGFHTSILQTLESRSMENCHTLGADDCRIWSLRLNVYHSTYLRRLILQLPSITRTRALYPNSNGNLPVRTYEYRPVCGFNNVNSSRQRSLGIDA